MNGAVQAGRRRWLARCAAATLGTTFLRGAPAADPAQAAAVASSTAGASPPLAAELIKTGLYLIRGGGAHSLLRFTASGLILVDGKSPGQYRPLMSQVRKINKISDLPLRAIALTNHREDRAGTAAEFLKAGVPVVAQRETAKRLSVAAAGGDVPGLRVFEAGERIHMGGVEVLLQHSGAGCTAGDTIAQFPDLRVVALGDLTVAGPLRLDYAGGGSLVGWSQVLAQVAKLDFDIAVPASGALQSKADVIGFSQRVDAYIAATRQQIRDGASRSQMASSLIASYPDWASLISGDAFEQILSELSH